MMRANRRHCPPETLTQAAEWERTKARYLGLGLCHKCAAQAAYGHQQHAGGWSVINPPCFTCAAVVAQLPIETTNPAWRKSARHPQPLIGAPPRSTAQQGAKDGAVEQDGAPQKSVVVPSELQIGGDRCHLDQIALDDSDDVGQVATDSTAFDGAHHDEAAMRS
jgi:hypothetical protein